MLKCKQWELIINSIKQAQVILVSTKNLCTATKLEMQNYHTFHAENTVPSIQSDHTKSFHLNWHILGSIRHIL